MVFGSWFQVSIHCRMSVSRSATLVWTPRRMSLSVIRPTKRAGGAPSVTPAGIGPRPSPETSCRCTTTTFSGGVVVETHDSDGAVSCATLHAFDSSCTTHGTLWAVGHELGKSFGSTSAVWAVPPATGWRVIFQVW